MTLLSVVCFRLYRGGLHHRLSLRLQAQRVVQLVPLQQVLWQRRQSPLQVAPGETLQRWTTLSQAGPRQPGRKRSSALPLLFLSCSSVVLLSFLCPPSVVSLLLGYFEKDSGQTPDSIFFVSLCPSADLSIHRLR